MSVEEKLKSMKIVLPPAPAAVGAYIPWTVTGNLVFTSGQLPWRDGQIAFPGKLGAEVSVEDGYEAATLCAINALAQLKAAANGVLDRVEQIIRIEGYVHAAPDFREHPKVLNGASDFFNAVFGERGRHTRLAVGINEMPLNAPVQLTVTAALADGSRQ